MRWACGAIIVRNSDGVIVDTAPIFWRFRGQRFLDVVGRYGRHCQFEKLGS